MTNARADINAATEIVVNVCTDRTVNAAAVHCLRWSVSYRCFTHLEQSATSRHFGTISPDFPKKRLKPFLFSRSFPS